MYVKTLNTNIKKSLIIIKENWCYVKVFKNETASHVYVVLAGERVKSLKEIFLVMRMGHIV